MQARQGENSRFGDRRERHMEKLFQALGSNVVKGTEVGWERRQQPRLDEEESCCQPVLPVLKQVGQGTDLAWPLPMIAREQFGRRRRVLEAGGF